MTTGSKYCLAVLSCGKTLSGSPVGALIEEPAKSPADPEDGICLTVPAKRMRRDGAVHLIIPANASVPTQNSRPALIKAVARGRAWYDQIIAGHLPDLKSLARKTGLTAYYVKNVLSCAFLAPDIVEAILDGRQPPTLKLRDLYKSIPLSWAEQRKQFGFAQRRCAPLRVPPPGDSTYHSSEVLFRSE